MQVVKNDQDRLARRRALPQAGDRVEQLEARLGCIGRRLQRRLQWQPRCQAHVEHGEVRGRGAERRQGRRFVVRRDVLPHRLQPWPVRGRAGLFGATAPQHLKASSGSMFGNVLCHARLADTRRPGKHHDTTLARTSEFERVVDRGKFLLAPDERVFPRRL